MPPTPPRPGPTRPADVVNALIRALLLRTGGWLYGPTRVEYEELRDEWTVATAAERDGLVEAA
jgi:hypothetical protein